MKTCFKCERLFPLTDFYAHPMMADGHLNKCKDCTKNDTAIRLREKMKDPVFVEAEIERHRLKQQKRRELGLVAPIPRDVRRMVLKRHALKYPVRQAARIALHCAVSSGKVIRKPCIVCGSTDSEGHHDDYSLPLDVVWLCPKHHAERHRAMRRQKRMEAVA